MTTNHSASARDKSKSPSHALAGRLENEAGLNKAQIRLALDAVDDHLSAYHSTLRPPGVITHTAVSIKEPAGKPIKACQVVPVQLAVMHEADVELHRTKGPVEVRMARLYRFCCAARAQGGLLSHEDLCVLLGVDISTIGDYVGTLRARGVTVPTRGAVKDIGQEPSHKRIIADLLGRGFSTTEIRAMTGHSEGAIGRYQQQFALCVYLLHTYPDSPADDLRRLSGLSLKAYETYALVYRELVEHPECAPHLERLRRRYELDPEGLAYKPPEGKAPRNNSAKRLQDQSLDTAVRQTIQEDLGTTERVAQIVAGDVIQLIDKSFRITDAVRPGEVLTFVDAHDGSLLSGEHSTDRKVLPVALPLFTEEALEIWRNEEPIGRRRAHIAVHLALAAREQGAIMSVAKLGEMLHVAQPTLARDLRELAAAYHIEAPTKGLVEDAGPTLTHKTWIVGLDHYGLTADEISYLTRHAPVSRDRYLETYRRAEALMRLERELPDADHLARLLDLRPHVAQQYLDLLRKFHGDGKASPDLARTSARPEHDPASEVQS